MDEKQKKKRVIKISVLVISIFVIFFSITYAFINLTLQGTKRQVITAGNLQIDLIEDENNITLTNALPMYDEVGMIQEPFTFRLKNKGTTDINYTLKLSDITTGDKLETSDVKYYLTKDGTGTPALLSTLTDGQVDSGTIVENQTIEYTLRLWIDASVTENSRISGKSLSYRIDVEAGKKMVDENGCEVLTETTPNAPELTSGMIPVVYDEAGKTWKKADISSEWYNYSNQNWANAVTVTEATRAGYMSAAVGSPIDINDINTMWVWIPRYSYTIRDTYGVQLAGGSVPSKTTPGAIDIKFIAKNQKDSGTGKCETCATNWITPEGFTFGDEELSGFWMAKFETTGSMSAACTGENCTTADLTVLPNKSSVRSQKVSSFFHASRSMQNSNNANKYGFDAIGVSSMDVHMLKNTEWGIVAMLSQSKYGKYGNSNYEGANKEIYMNKSSSYTTGNSNGTPSTSTTNAQVTYDTSDTGYGASTTGTVYGVYDMSGGAYEYVMGNYNNVSGSSASYNSGFVGTNGPTTGGLAWPDSKYYDLYTSTAESTGYKVGDATYETSGWYSDFANFVNSSGPWFLRGGRYNNNTEAGVFSMGYNVGSSNSYYGFRLAIKP